MLAAIASAELTGQDDAAAQQPRRVVIAPHNVDRLTQIDEINEYAWKIVFSPDGERVAFVSWEGPVQIRDADDLELQTEFTTEKGPIHFAFSPDPDWVAYCENGAAPVLHNFQTEDSIVPAVGNAQHHVAFSPDGSLLATGSYGTEARLWTVPEGTLVRVLRTGTKEGGLTPVFSPDGSLIAVGNRNSTTTIFDVESGQAVHVLNVHMTQELAFSPDSARLAVTYVDGTLRTWDVATGAMLAQFDSGAEELYTVSWSPDGNLIATAGLHGDLIVAESFDLKPVARIESPEWVIDVRFTPDGTRLLSSGGPLTDSTIRAVRVFGIPNE